MRWAAVVTWAALIFLLSAQPGLRVTQDKGVDLSLRHVAHIAVYCVLTCLVGWALSRQSAPTARVTVIAAIMALLYGVSDEWHQTFVPDRTGRPEDLVWDGIGVAFGIMLLWVARLQLTHAGDGPPSP